MSDAPIKLPPPPDPLIVQQWMGQIRAFLPLLGGIAGTLGIAIPVLSDAQLSGYISAAMVLFGAASYGGTAFWSWLDKRKRDREKRAAEVAAAVASALATSQAGRPVAVTVKVTPPGQDNEVKPIPLMEIAAAPTVPEAAIAMVAPSPQPMEGTI